MKAKTPSTTTTWDGAESVAVKERSEEIVPGPARIGTAKGDIGHVVGLARPLVGVGVAWIT